VHPRRQAVGDRVGLFATVSSARRNASGSALPRFSARRRIPAHAFALKKNRDGIEPVSSTCDNEHTAASLGQAEILGVEGPPRDCSRGSKHTTSVRPFSPWRDERLIFAGKSSKKAAEGVVGGRKDSGDVFPKDNGWLLASLASNSVNCISYLAECERQVAPCVVKGPAQAGN
jgi:hypothetical protein